MDKCNFDPTQPPYDTAPIGMFHCPECGEMVVAGLPHPDWENVEKEMPPKGSRCPYCGESLENTDYLCPKGCPPF